MSKFDFSGIDESALKEVANLVQYELMLDHRTRVAIINKAMGLPQEADPQHSYSHRSGLHGDYDYYYDDPVGNQWKYTNAPGDHAHHDPKKGVPMLSPDQPMPHTAPEYFTADGKKRHAAIPAGVDPEINPNYHPDDPTNKWYETYADPVTGSQRFSYLDKDVRTDPELHIQYALRLVDANILKYRKYAVHSFNQAHPRDRAIGILMMLADQAFYKVKDLINATVGDLKFVGKTVVLFGRKFNCDEKFFLALVSLRSGRDTEQPLFSVDTAHGSKPLGAYFLSSIFKNLKIAPHFLMYWHATQMYSTIVHRLHATGEAEDIDTAAMEELADYLHTDEDVVHLVDPKVRKTLQKEVTEQQTAQIGGTEEPLAPVDTDAAVEKSINHSKAQDPYGVPMVDSELAHRTEDELAFSQWLHNEPMHHDALPEAPSEEVESTPVQKSVTVVFASPNVFYPGSVDLVLYAPSCRSRAYEYVWRKSSKAIVEQKLDGSLTKSFVVTQQKAVQTLEDVLSKALPGQTICFLAPEHVGLLLQQHVLFSDTQGLVKSLASLSGYSTFTYNLDDNSFTMVNYNTSPKAV